MRIFVTFIFSSNSKRRVFEKSLLLSPVTNNSFSISDKFADTPFEVKYKNFILGAKEYVKADPKGVLYLKLVEAGDGGREEHFLKEGEVQNIHNVLPCVNRNISDLLRHGQHYMFLFSKRREKNVTIYLQRSSPVLHSCKRPSPRGLFFV